MIVSPVRPDVCLGSIASYLYRVRNLIERFFDKITQCRRIATRYDKLAANYPAFVKLASIRIWLRANESAL
jgi:transposase